MSTIRKQAITSGFLVYSGFIIGAFNMYLYTKHFTSEQFGLTRLFTDFAQNILSFGSLGVLSVLYKFYPYYKANLKDKDNDLLTWVLCIVLLGFGVVCCSGYFFQAFIIRKFAKNSSLFLVYYKWVFPFGLGLLLFSTLEAFSWVVQKTVFSNFLKESALRLFHSFFILLYCCHVVSFSSFVILFSSSYLCIFLLLSGYLWSQNQLHFSFTISRVTKKFSKKMGWMQLLMFSGTIIFTLKATLDGIIISSLLGLSSLGVSTLAQYVANLVQVPQRSLQPISTGAISQAWKDKNYPEIQRIYARSSINMLLMALFVYGNVVLNAEKVIMQIGIHQEYLAGINLMVIVGFCWIIDAGTGVNNIIIGTSTYWRFEFFCGIILLFLIAPTNYFFIKSYGIIGSAYAQLLSMTIYNFIRWEFLRRKFNMQPFTFKTVYSLLWATTAFAVAYFTTINLHNWFGIVLRAGIFSVLLVAGIFYFQLTPDALQMWDKWKAKRRG